MSKKTNEQPLLKVTKGCIEIQKRERYADPRELQINLSTDLVDTTRHPDKTIQSNRVMPLLNCKKFFAILSRKTKTFKGADGSHFWVSGYYALHFYMKCKGDSRKIKKIVQDAYKESGGSMPFEKWYEAHNKKHCRIIQYNGTGSGITKTFDSITNNIAYL